MATVAITTPSAGSPVSPPFDMSGTCTPATAQVEVRGENGLLVPATANPVAATGGNWTVHITSLIGTKGAAYSAGNSVVVVQNTITYPADAQTVNSPVTFTGTAYSGATVELWDTLQAVTLDGNNVVALTTNDSTGVASITSSSFTTSGAKTIVVCIIGRSSFGNTTVATGMSDLNGAISNWTRRVTSVSTFDGLSEIWTGTTSASTSNDTITATLTSSTSYAGIYVLSITNAASTNFVGGTGNASNDVAPVAASMTVQAAGSVLLCVGGSGDYNGARTPLTGQTIIQDLEGSGYVRFVGYRISQAGDIGTYSMGTSAPASISGTCSCIEIKA